MTVPEYLKALRMPEKTETPMSAYARLCERRYGQSRKSGKFRGYAKRGHSKKK